MHASDNLSRLPAPGSLHSGLRPAHLNSLIGAPETDVVRQLGVPTRTFQAGGHTFLAYEQRSAAIYPTTSLFFGNGFYGPGFGLGYGAAFPPTVIERGCETTIDIAEGRMVTWSLRGNGCG